MGIGYLFWNLLAMAFLVALGGGFAFFVWWLWRKINNPDGANAPKLSDLAALKSGGGKAPVIIRLVLASVLVMFMSAPIEVISQLVDERGDTYKDVVRELAQTWGGQQQLIGPVLSIPYTIEFNVAEEVLLSEAEKQERAKLGDTSLTKVVTRKVVQHKNAFLLPEELYVEGSLEPQERKRGIYSVRVYTADLGLSGRFKKPDFKKLDSRTSEVHWDRASILVNLSDTKAFKGISPLTINELEYKFVPGTKNSHILPTGFSADVDLSADRDMEFSFHATVGGSQGFYISPIAVNSSINLKSPWPHPKFGGTGLPTRHEINEAGFNAVWEVPNLVRNYLQFADTEDFKEQGGLDLSEYIIGLDFFEPVFHYSLLTRAVKYAMLFIGLTFLCVLIFEMVSGHKTKLHLAQYAVIGIGLCLFYLVLLAVAEHIPFLNAYILAAAVNILMIGGYVLAALKRVSAALLVTAILATLYSALFFILKMEQYALLSGTALLIAATCALMYVTRNLGRDNAEQTQ